MVGDAVVRRARSRLTSLSASDLRGRGAPTTRTRHGAVAVARRRARIDKGSTVTLTVAKSPRRSRSPTSPADPVGTPSDALSAGSRSRRQPGDGRSTRRTATGSCSSRTRPAAGEAQGLDGDDHRGEVQRAVPSRPDERPAEADQPRPRQGRHEGRGPGRRAARRARGLAGLRSSVRDGLVEAGHEVRGSSSRATATWCSTATSWRCAPGAACSARTSPSRCCTARSARTGRCRGCSSCSTSPTSAPACWRARCAWTRSCSRT